MTNGIAVLKEEGTPQGGSLLSNITLDKLDKKLERRGHRFYRYAGNCNIYVKSKRDGGRIVENITRFSEGKLRIKVNINKGAIKSF